MSGVLPTDVYDLVELMAAEDHDPDQGAGPDLWDRLCAQEGQDRASRLWMAACAEMDRQGAADAAVEDLSRALLDALSAVDRATGALDTLGGEGWHSDYAESLAAGDMRVFLTDAARCLRAAAALNPVGGER